MKYDINAIKAAAAGRWAEVYRTLAGVEIDPNTSHHGPCPKCGGTDRFRMIDATTGALFCNQCFNEKNGDGIAGLGWLTGQSFRETLKALADHLNVRPTKAAAPAKEPKAKTHATVRGLVLAVLPAMTKKYGSGVKLAGHWQYPTFAVLRFNLPTPAGEKQRKEFRPIHQVPIGSEGVMGWRAGYPDGQRPLYRLPEAAAADPALITIHGGEKATDAAAALGLPATTNAGGEQAVKRTDWTPLARFATVAIVVDNDPAGEKFGRMVAAVLHQQQPAQVIKIIRLPNLPPKGDIVEWIAAGGTAERFHQVVEQMPVAKEEELDPFSEDRKICEELGIDVLGEVEGGGVKIFSRHFGKTTILKRVGFSTVVDLLQQFGPVVREKVHGGKDDIPGLYQIGRVQEAIALLGGAEMAGEGSELGQGVWRAENDLLVLVNPKISATWDDRNLTEVRTPRIGGLTVNMNLAANQKWFDHERLAGYLNQAVNVKWAEDTIAEAADIFRKWNWPQKMATAPELVAGLILATFVESVWQWRPLVAITSESDAGKSLFFETLALIFGPIALLNAKSSEAGIRQSVGQHAKAILCDEFESDIHREKIMEFFRTASRGSQTLRGTSNQQAQRYGLRHIPWCAAVGIKLDRAPDRNRFIFLEFQPVPKEQRGKIDLPSESKLADLGQRLLAIAVRSAVAADRLAVKLRSTMIQDVHGRVVESYSTPAAMLATAIGLDEEHAINLIRTLVAKTEQDPGQATKDQTELLGDILSSEVSLDHGNKATVAQLLNSPDLYPGSWEALERMGIRPIGRDGTDPFTDSFNRAFLFVATGQIRRYLLKGTRWAEESTDQILLRLEGSERSQHKVGGSRPRGIRIPWPLIVEKYLRDDDDQPPDTGHRGF